ncbi:MAG: CARDB domain-containing protein, partial [Patescibacteria group bacterium]
MKYFTKFLHLSVSVLLVAGTLVPAFPTPAYATHGGDGPEPTSGSSSSGGGGGTSSPTPVPGGGSSGGGGASSPPTPSAPAVSGVDLMFVLSVGNPPQITENGLTDFTVRNDGDQAAAPAFPDILQLAVDWVDANQNRVGDLTFIDEGVFDNGLAAETDVRVSNNAVVNNFVRDIPDAAVSLRLVIDSNGGAGNGVVAEVNENNNTLLIQLPPNGVDLTVVGNAPQLTVVQGLSGVSVQNTGRIGTNDFFQLAIDWVDAAGNRIQGANGGVTFIDDGVFDNGLAAGASQEIRIDPAHNLFDFVTNPPQMGVSLRLVIDSNGAQGVVNEVNENNNTLLVAMPEVPSGGGPEVMINELFPHPGLLESMREFVELRKTVDEDVDITGWVMQTTAGGDMAVFDQTHTDTLNEEGFLIVSPQEFEVSLVNGGDTVELFDSLGGDLMDSVTYGDTSARVGESFSFQEGEGFVFTSIPTPGEDNRFLTIGLPDLFVTRTQFGEDGSLQVTVMNGSPRDGVVNAPLAFSAFWVGADGEAMGARMQTDGSYTIDPERDIVVSFGPQAVSSFVDGRPENAAASILFVDSEQSLVESDEQNNLPEFVPFQLPDLRVSAASYDGETGTITASVINAGAAATGNPAVVFASWEADSGEPIGGSFEIGIIGSGFSPSDPARAFATGFVGLPPDVAARLLVAVDPQNQVEEANEENNTMTIALDTEPTSVTLSLDDGEGTMYVNNLLEMTVRNTGATDMTAEGRLRLAFLDANGAVIAGTSPLIFVPRLLAGGAVTVRMAAGEFEFQDEESGERVVGDEAFETIMSTPPVDAVSVRVELDGNAPFFTAEQTVLVENLPENRANSDATLSGQSTVTVNDEVRPLQFAEVDGSFIADLGAVPSTVESLVVSPVTNDPAAQATVNGVAPNAEGQVSVNLVEGENTITISVNAEDQITVRQYTIRVVRLFGTLPDLGFVSADVSETTGEIAFEVQNQSEIDIGGQVEVVLEWFSEAGNVVQDRQYVVQTFPSQAILRINERRIPETAVRAFLTIDRQNVIEEGNEGNNTVQIELLNVRPQYPDLEITNALVFVNGFVSLSVNNAGNLDLPAGAELSFTWVNEDGNEGVKETLRDASIQLPAISANSYARVVIDADAHLNGFFANVPEGATVLDIAVDRLGVV